MTSRRRGKLRVANVAYLVGLPYAHLRDLAFAEYEENTAAENARKLHEREVDVALMPIAEFAHHGGYVGLDFGVVCEGRSDSMMIYANDEISSLRTIWLDEGAGSSVVLLRLLLAERWQTVPRLLRERTHHIATPLEPFEGRLEIHENMGAYRPGYRVAADVVAEWYRMTKLPFVPLVWATRPGVLSRDQYLTFHQRFHVGLKMREVIAQVKAPQLGIPVERLQQYLEQTLSYQLRAESLASVDEFFRRAAAQTLLPNVRYRSATFTLLDQRSARHSPHRAVDDILGDAIQGRRLSVSDGVILARNARLSDLGMVADSVRAKLVIEPLVSRAVLIDSCGADAGPVRAKVEDAVAHGARRVLLLFSQVESASLEFYEGLLNELKADYDVEIEAFSARDILVLSLASGVLPQEVIRRLITAGLDAVPSFDGGMLIDRSMRRRTPALRAADWLHAMKWVHRYGGKSSCCMLLGPDETWEERLLHLHKLRFFQGENPGFAYFFTELGAGWKKSPPIELRLRATAIARLFLDNVPCFQEIQLTKDVVGGALSLSFGVGELRIDMGAESAPEVLRFLERSWSVGPHLRTAVSKAESEDTTVH